MIFFEDAIYSAEVRSVARVFLNFLLPSKSCAINLSLFRIAAHHQSPFVYVHRLRFRR